MKSRFVSGCIVTLFSLVPRAPAHAQAAAQATAFVPDGNMERSAVPDRFKWKLDALFASDAEFERALAETAAGRARLSAFRGRLGDPSALHDCLAAYFDLRLATNKLTLYGTLRYVTDQDSTALQALQDKSQAALHELMAASNVIRQEVLALPDAVLAAAYEREPRLAAYRPYLDQMRRRKAHVLGAEAERVLALAGDNLWAEIDLNEIPSDFEKTFTGALTDLPLPVIRDERGEPVQLTLSNYGKYRASADRRVRREAVAGLFGALRRHEHTLAGTLAGQVRFNVFLARARGYDTALAAYLDRENIPPAVYHNLIAAVRANLRPLHDYIALRKQVMKLDDLHVYDLYTPLVPSVDLRFPYDEALRLLPEALAPLGPEYVSVLRRGLDLGNGWIDLYPNRHKESGAFSSSVHGLHPFVKMNYYDGYDDLSTLAHEMGHALHSHESSRTQPYVTSSYSPFIAEVASTMNEKLLSDHVLSRAASDDERLYLLNRLLESIRTTIYRQALFAEFELALHTLAEAGRPLTADVLDETYRRLAGDYYGPGLTLDADDGVEWAYIPHFYYKYYVYAYATGLSSGIALAERVQAGDPQAREAYLGLLRAGSSKPPLEILRDAGVDLTRPDAVVAAARLMQLTIGEMRAVIERRPK
jgi:oligoendopeptidase F